jgi:alpha-glucosidase
MADFGYDVSDYTGTDLLFGSLEEFDALLAAAHEHGLNACYHLAGQASDRDGYWFHYRLP